MTNELKYYVTSSDMLFFFIVSRNNGILVNITAHIGKKMKLDNGTVDMDIAKIFGSKLDDAGVVLISLQFDSGS